MKPEDEVKTIEAMKRGIAIKMGIKVCDYILTGNLRLQELEDLIRQNERTTTKREKKLENLVSMQQKVNVYLASKIEELLYDFHIRGCVPGNDDSNLICDKRKAELKKMINKLMMQNEM